jgi:hypothetical protein
MTVNSAHTGMLAWGALIGTAEDDCRDQAAAENPADTHAVSERPRNMASIMPAAKLQNRTHFVSNKFSSTAKCYPGTFRDLQ